MTRIKKESEKKTERYLTGRVKSLGGLCIKISPQYFRGLPDRLCLLPGGCVFFVETKSQGDKPRLAQRLIHDKIHGLGVNVYVCDTKEKIDNVIKLYISGVI